MNSVSHTALSQYAERDIVPDARAESEFWRQAPFLTMETDVYGTQIPGHGTEIRARWTQKNLYFLFICPYLELHLKPHPDTASKTNGLWNWDVAEIFIGALDDPLHRYREFEVSPQEEWLDLDINLEKPDKVNNPAWRSGLEVAARIEPEEKVWYACMRIPYAAIDARNATAGHELRINFFRSQGPKPLEIAWRPPLQESFHVPEQFGLLRLVL